MVLGDVTSAYRWCHDRRANGADPVDPVELVQRFGLEVIERTGRVTALTPLLYNNVPGVTPKNVHLVVLEVMRAITVEYEKTTDRDLDTELLVQCLLLNCPLRVQLAIEQWDAL